MKDYLRSLVERASNPIQGRNLAREYLQARILHTLQRNGAMHQSQVLAVRIEVDTNPPAGAVLETSIVRRYVVLQLQHHDKSSLLAGKIHAVLQRRYVKGRDLYDLMWYLSDPEWPAPNLVMLNNALRQTAWDGPAITLENWRDILWQRIQTMDWSRLIQDVRPFLDSSIDVQLLTKETFKRLLIGE